MFLRLISLFSVCGREPDRIPLSFEPTGRVGGPDAQPASAQAMSADLAWANWHFFSWTGTESTPNRRTTTAEEAAAAAAATETGTAPLDACAAARASERELSATVLVAALALLLTCCIREMVARGIRRWRVSKGLEGGELDFPCPSWEAAVFLTQVQVNALLQTTIDMRCRALTWAFVVVVVMQGLAEAGGEAVISKCQAYQIAGGVVISVLVLSAGMDAAVYAGDAPAYGCRASVYGGSAHCGATLPAARRCDGRHWHVLGHTLWCSATFAFAWMPCTILLFRVMGVDDVCDGAVRCAAPTLNVHTAHAPRPNTHLTALSGTLPALTANFVLFAIRHALITWTNFPVRQGIRNLKQAVTFKTGKTGIVWFLHTQAAWANSFLRGEWEQGADDRRRIFHRFNDRYAALYDSNHQKTWWFGIWTIFKACLIGLFVAVFASQPTASAVSVGAVVIVDAVIQLFDPPDGDYRQWCLNAYRSLANVTLLSSAFALIQVCFFFFFFWFSCVLY